MRIAVLGHSQARYLEFKQYNIRVFYKSGANFRNIQESSQFQSFINYKPDLVFLLLGSNDIRENNENSNINSIVSNYIELKEEIQERIQPREGTYLLDLEKRTLDNKYINKDIFRKIRNSLIKKIKKIDKNSFIPYRPVSGLLDSDIGPDGIHVNYRGAKKIAETIEEKVNDIIRNQ